MRTFSRRRRFSRVDALGLEEVCKQVLSNLYTCLLEGRLFRGSDDCENLVNLQESGGQSSQHMQLAGTVTAMHAV